MTDDEARPLLEVIRRAAAARGVRLGNAKGVFFCVGTEAGPCDVEVPERGTYCERCAAQNNRALRARLLRRARATLPAWDRAAFGHPDFAAAVDPQLAKAARAWRPTDAVSTLTMLGSSGVGKTTAGIAVCRRILDLAEERALPPDVFGRARGLRFLKARDLAGSAKRAPLGAGRSPEMVEALRAPILFLDELGFEERDTDVDHLFDQRYSTPGFVTIVTSGLDVEELAQRYGEATRRRFTERGILVERFLCDARGCKEAVRRPERRCAKHGGQIAADRRAS